MYMVKGAVGEQLSARHERDGGERKSEHGDRKSDAKGEAIISNAPAGPVKVTIWHPYAKAKDQMITATATVSADGPTRLEVTLDVASPTHHH